MPCIAVGETHGVSPTAPPSSPAETPDPSSISSPAQSREPAPAAAPSASSTDSPAVLRGQAQIGGIAAALGEIRPYLLCACRGRGFQCLHVQLKNGSGSTATVDGEKAALVIAGQSLAPQAPEFIAKHSNCVLSSPAKTALVAASLPLLGLPGPILFEMMTNKRDNYFYNNGYGWVDDGPRREVEQLRFGKRILLNGDETDGWFCFQGKSWTDTGILRIPVMMPTGQGYIDLTVAGQASGIEPGTVPTQK